MRILRFITPQDEVHYGRPLDEHSAEILDGDPLQGLTASGRRAQISRLLAPIVPCNILCIGLNYRAHAEETGAALPEDPVLFMKPTSALSDPGAPIRIPRSCSHGPEVDYEAELAVVIGRAARDIPQEQALSYVLGYTCANDVSARRWQKHGGGGQWVRGKSFDSFCPLGPHLVTAEEIPDPQALGLRCWLNGELMQDGHTDDMIFPVARLIHLLSRDTTLLPGTLILTGTPPGVGFARTPPRYLSPGDRVRVEIDVIGSLENPVAE